MFTTILLHAGLVPLLISAIAAVVMRRVNWPPSIIWPVAIVGGFLAGQLAIRSEPGIDVALRHFIRPQEAVDWLPLIVLLALGVSIVMFYATPAGRLRSIALAAALALAAPVRLVSGNVRLTQQWSAFEKLLCLLLLSATLAFVWRLLSSEAGGKQAILRVPLLILVTVGTAAVVTKAGAFINGLSCGAVAAAIVGTALVFAVAPAGARSGAAGSTNSWRRLAFPGIPGMAGVITFSLGNLILLGHFFAELSAANAMLLFLALGATGAPLPAWIRQGPFWQPLAARAALCLFPLALAVIGSLT